MTEKSSPHIAPMSEEQKRQYEKLLRRQQKRKRRVKRLKEEESRKDAEKKLQDKKRKAREDWFDSHTKRKDTPSVPTKQDSTNVTEDAQKITDIQLELHRAREEERYSDALLRLETGSINLLRVAKGVIDDFHIANGGEEALRVDFGAIEGVIGRKYFLDFSLAYPSISTNPEFVLSKKVRVIYNPKPDDPQNAYPILISDPEARKRNREEMEHLRQREQEEREQLDADKLAGREKMEKKYVRTFDLPDSDFTTYVAGTNNLDIQDDLLDALKAAKPTFDYRNTKGRPDYLVESRELVWDNSDDVNGYTVIQHHGQ